MCDIQRQCANLNLVWLLKLVLNYIVAKNYFKLINKYKKLIMKLTFTNSENKNGNI